MVTAARALPRADVAALDRSVAAMSAASCDVLIQVADADERELWKADGATSMSAWLAGRYRIARRTAREWVRVGHALADLPLIAEAYARGRFSWDQVRFLTRFVTPHTEELWVRRARGMSPQHLWVEARRHERISDREAADAHARRHLLMWWDEERPLLYLRGMLPGEQGSEFEAAISRLAEKLEPDPGAVAPGEARFADALARLADGSPGSQRQNKPVLVVHAAAEVLAQEEESSNSRSLSETEGGQRLAAETVRRLACDANVDLVLEAEGSPVGIGRRGRMVPPGLERVVRHRDRGCRFPGCERTLWTDVHHIVHWARGGTTDLENLILLCDAHHRLVHDGGWEARGKAEDVRFYDPGGQPLRTEPPELSIGDSGFP